MQAIIEKSINIENDLSDDEDIQELLDIRNKIKKLANKLRNK